MEEEEEQKHEVKVVREEEEIEMIPSYSFECCDEHQNSCSKGYNSWKESNSLVLPHPKLQNEASHDRLVNFPNGHCQQLKLTLVASSGNIYVKI